ncbi:N-acetyltransferase [Acrocarpospora pleiomorpha]|uniref:N-acetyltransferase n=1 Tax=Acrocarpospora pleiomorpha TaxID=90975 RepID=A0A5M3Y050_9ACTN|nr:GNAT family N-acetyltransferase [Acrocarpospora pleiomorpha]GES26714.1 N-acetyltransferase [Acrocarpospora pleiomorpha]
MTQVSLQPITDANRAAVVALDVTPAQRNYVTGVAGSLADALRYPQAMPWYRAIYAGGAPVGFVMISDNIPPGDPTLLGPYFLWRLLVDARYQGSGYGRAALGLVVSYLRTRPAAHELLTSVAPGEDSSPLGFYQRLGFQDTGEFFDGERVLRLPLR